MRLVQSSSWSFVFLVVLAALLMVPMGTDGSPGCLTRAALDGGDFSLDWVASAPQTYDHTIGGGAYDDRTIGVGDDVVESLEGGDFTCDDIVTFLLQISVDEGASGAQDLELDFRFAADTTGQSGAAFSTIESVQVNYGDVGGDGPGGTDLGIQDDGGSVASLVSTSLTGAIFTQGAELLGTVLVTDLEASETVVLRVDVQIDCLVGSSPTGNLYSRLESARVVSPTLDTVPGGSQTIPLKHIGDIAPPPAKIGDYVWSDDNCDGMQNGTEVGLAGVTVNLYEASDPGTVFMTAMTDGAGFYQFCVPDGSYMVEFIAPGGMIYTLQSMGSDPEIDSDPDLLTGLTDVITVAAGETHNYVDAGFCDCAGPAATSTSIGDGCGAPAAPVLAADPPIVGQEMHIQLSSDHPNAHYWIFASVGTPTPYTDPISGCTIYVDVFNSANLVFLDEGFTDATGSASWSLMIPPDAPSSVYGIPVTFQARTWFPGGPLNGDHMSNGVLTTIGCF